MKLLTPSLTACTVDAAADGTGTAGSGGDAFGFLACLLFTSMLGLTVAFGTAAGGIVVGFGTTGCVDCVGGATAGVGAAGGGSAGLTLVFLTI